MEEAFGRRLADAFRWNTLSGRLAARRTTIRPRGRLASNEGAPRLIVDRFGDEVAPILDRVRAPGLFFFDAVFFVSLLVLFL